MSSMVAHCAMLFFEERRNGSGFLNLVALYAHEPMFCLETRLRSPSYLSLKIRYHLLSPVQSSLVHDIIRELSLEIKPPGCYPQAGERVRSPFSAVVGVLDRRIWTCQAWEGILWTSLHFRRLFPTSSMECQVLTKDAIDWITMTDASIETVIEIRGEMMTFGGTVVVRGEDLPATGFHQK